VIVDINAVKFIKTVGVNIGKDISFTVISSCVNIYTFNNLVYMLNENYIQLCLYRFLIYINCGMDMFNVKMNNSSNMLHMYVGHHDDFGLNFANILIPCNMWLEKNLLYLDRLNIPKEVKKVISIINYDVMNIDNMFVVIFIKMLLCTRIYVVLNTVSNVRYISFQKINYIKGIFKSYFLNSLKENIITRNSLNCKFV